jgi:hypothetical protein
MVKAFQGVMRLAFVAIAIFMAMVSAASVNKTASAFGSCDLCLGAGKCDADGGTKCCDVTSGGQTYTCYKDC